MKFFQRKGNRQDSQDLDFGFAVGGPVDATPVVEELRVFKRARVSTDKIARNEIGTLRLLAQPPTSATSEVVGEVSLDESRLVATTNEGEELFALPTTRGWVCLVVPGVEAGYCARSLLREGIAFSVQKEGPDVLIIGVAGDAIKDVGVRSGNVVEATTFGENAFIFRSPARSGVFTALVVRRVDGTAEEIPLEAELFRD